MFLQPIEQDARIYLNRRVYPNGRVDDVGRGAFIPCQDTSDVLADKRQLFVEGGSELRNAALHGDHAAEGGREHEVTGPYAQRAAEGSTPRVIAFRPRYAAHRTEDTPRRLNLRASFRV